MTPDVPRDAGERPAPGREPEDPLHRLLVERGDQPFGDLDLAAGRDPQPRSMALRQGAANFLKKAAEAMAAGDLGRAEEMATKAARMPYDPHERTAPAGWEAHMMLFDEVVDVLEANPVDDSRWLDAAEHAMADADEFGRYVLRDVLAAIINDYELSSREVARVRSLTATVPPRVELTDLDLEPDELARHVLAVLAVCTAYRSALSTN